MEKLERSREIKICYLGAGSKKTGIRVHENVPFPAFITKIFPGEGPPEPPSPAESVIFHGHVIGGGKEVKKCNLACSQSGYFLIFESVML